MKTVIQALWKKQWMRFLWIGALNTFFGYGVYALLLILGASYFIGSLCSIIVGIVFSFHTHSTVVFRSAVRGIFWRYLVVWTLLYLGNILLIGYLIQVGLSAYVAGLLTTLPNAMLSYLLQRRFVFRDLIPG